MARALPPATSNRSDVIAGSGIDLHALVGQLAGPGGLIVLIGADGQVLYRAGSNILGRALIDDAFLEQPSKVNWFEQITPIDRPTLATAMESCLFSNQPQAPIIVTGNHSDGTLRKLNVTLTNVRDTLPGVALMIKVLDITPSNGSISVSREAERSNTIRSIVEGLTDVATHRLKSAIGNATIELAACFGADAIVIECRGPNGRGIQWNWSQLAGIRREWVAGDGPEQISSLGGPHLKFLRPQLIRAASDQPTNERAAAMIGQGSTTLATGGSEWGGGYETRLWLGWSVEIPGETERSLLELGPIAQVLQPTFARLLNDVAQTADRRRLERIFTWLADVVLVWDESGRISFGSPSIEAMLQRSVRIDGLQMSDVFVGAEDYEQRMRTLQSGESSGIEQVQIRVGKEIRIAEVMTVNLKQTPSICGFVTTGRDVTKQIAEEARQQRRDALTNLIASVSSRFVNGNAGTLNLNIARSLAELSSYAAVSRAILFLADEDDVFRPMHEHATNSDDVAHRMKPLTMHEVKQLIPSAAQGEVELCVRDDHGGAFISRFEVLDSTRLGAALVIGLSTERGLIGLITLSVVEQEDGSIPLEHIGSPEAATALRTVGELLTNVMDRNATQSALTFNATHDPLTGLANRRLVVERCDRMLRTAPRRGNGLGLLFLDLDDFKVVNDTLGHEAGDELLTDVATRLRALAHGSTVIGRLGGDEFVMLIEAKDPKQVVTDLAKRVSASLATGFMIRDRRLTLKTSIGAVVTEPGQFCRETPSDLVRRADMAMYSAKNRGGNSFEIFSEALEERTQRRFNLHEELAEAITENQLELWFQPQVDLWSLSIVGCEALVRWRHPSKGFILPHEFIGVAEQTGLIRALGNWVTETAGERMAEWVSSGLVNDSFSVAVNVSAVQLVEASLLSDFVAVRERHGLAANRLTVELTESTLAQRDLVIPNLVALRGAGFPTSIDDFGTGYSSLSYLRDLPLTELKIDRSFVQAIEDDARDQEMVRALIGMAHALGLSVVAEGIETEGQRRLLREMGCTVGQGWLFSRAIPAHDMRRLLIDQPRDSHGPLGSKGSSGSSPGAEKPTGGATTRR
jgi:diguanylate cyclase (GGDEF)-like protein